MPDIFSDKIEIQNLELAKKMLLESRTGFQQLFNNSPVCMSMTTTTLGKRIYVRVNKKFLEKFGYLQEDIIGRSSIEAGILDPEESVRVGEIIKEKGRLQNDYVKCRAKDGKIVHTVSSIEKMEMGGEIFLVSFFVDISTVIEQQAIIEQHAQQLEAVNKELEAFSYSVSHDLRAPLRIISGYTKILEEDFQEVFNDEAKHVMSIVQSNTKKMGILIDDLLEFARLGKKPVQKTEIDMDALISDILNDLKVATNHKAEIKVSPLSPVKGDYALIKQVVLNLISNAVKYSSKKPEPRVEINSEITNGRITYIVKDNGEGFDMKYASKLFGVFQRLHTNEEFEGTGVGLAIVQRILNKHGGTIKVEAEKGEGATFSFTLPLEN